MVAIFTGAGAGFTRGSADLLGSAGQLGSGKLGWGGENVAVNAATGNLVVATQDEFLVGRGPDIGISRTYNSFADAADGDNGDNWQQSTTRRVFALTGTANTVGSTVNHQAGDGSVIEYSWDDAAGAYVSTDGSGAFDTLTYAAGSWTWTDGDSQITETYEAHGTDNWRIVAASDTDGNSLTYSYVGDKLDKVTTADGSWTQYVWSSNNIAQIVTGYTDLATSASQTLTRTRYSYDGSNRLASVTTDLSPHDSSIADGATYTVSYAYDGESNRIASISQTDGSLLTITYDAVGRVASLTQSVATGEARVTTLTYGAGYTEVTGPDGEVTRLDYDGAGRLTGITAPPAHTGATPQQVQFAYDEQGNLTDITDAAGNVTAYDHDANGNVTRVTDANGNVIERTYDAENRLITELAYGSDESGPNAAHYAQYAYDAEGHLRYAVDGAGQVTKYEYTATGEVARRIEFPEHPYPVGAAVIDEAGMDAWVASLGDLNSTKVVAYTYDARGNQTTTSAYEQVDASGANPTNVGVHQTTFQVYDQTGQLLSRHRDGELAETFLYDGLGRLVASTDVNGGTTTIVFDDAALTTTVTTASGLVTVSVYNRAGELVSRTDSGASTAGGTATYQYDRNGRLRIVADATGRESYIVYDQAGRKVADVNHLREIVAYRYDQADRLVATIRYSGALDAAQLALLADPDTSAELSALLPATSGADQWNWTVYDDGGRVIQEIGADGSVVVFDYDASDRLVKTTSYLNVLTPTELNALKQASPATPVLPVADAADVISRQFYNAAGLLVGTLDAEGYVRGFTYDAEGRKIGETAWPDGIAVSDTTTTVQVATLAADAGSPIALSYSYDQAGRLLTSTDGEGIVTRHFYNALGQITDTYLADNVAADTVRLHYEYDAAGRLTAEYQAYGAAEQAGSFYAYDGLGNRISATDANGNTTTYTHDELGRVLTATNALGGVTAYQYDGFGNVVKRTDPNGNETYNYYDNLNRLVATRDAEDYLTETDYNRFNEVIAVRKYNIPLSYPAEVGVKPVIDDSIPPEVTAAYDHAAQLQANADALAAQLVTLDADLAAVLADPLPWLENYVDELNVELADLEAQRDAAQANGDWLLWLELRGQITNLEDDIGDVERAIQRYQNGNGLSNDGRNIIEAAFDHDTLESEAQAAQQEADQALVDAQALEVQFSQSPAETRFDYDRRGLLKWKIDAEGYFEHYTYDAFGQRVTLSRYVDPVEDGVLPIIEDYTPPPEVVAAYDHAAQLQTDADALAAQLADLDVNLAAALADPLSYLQAHLDGLNAQLATLNAELADLQQQYDEANAFEKYFVIRPQIDALEDDIDALEDDIDDVEAEIQRVQNGQSLTGLGVGIVEAAFDSDALESQVQAAQAAADQALADAQTLEAQYLGVQATTQFAYDNRGQLTRVTDAEGYFETFEYDAYGQRVSHTAKSSTASAVFGGTTTYVYDKRGLLLSETLPIASYTSGGVVQAPSITNSYVYDARGNRLAMIEADGLTEERTTTYTYDKLDRLIETKGDQVSGLTVSPTNRAISSTSGRPTETIAYDPRGNVIKTVDAAGARTVFFYDELNRKVAEINALGTYTSYEYDANGNIAELRVYDQTVNVPATGGAANQAPSAPSGAYRETRFTYDGLGRMLSSQVLGAVTGEAVSSAWNASTTAITTSYEYDYLGNVVKLTDPNNETVWSYYDKLGRKVSQVDGELYRTDWIYDYENNVLTETRYASRAAVPDNTNTPPAVTANAANDRITEYTYDLNGNRLSETRLNVKVHNGSGGYSTVNSTISYLYNGLGQVIRKTEATGDQTNYAYDAGGRVTREVKSRSAVDYRYDGLGNLVRSVQAAVNGSAARVTTYSYGAGGRLAGMTDAAGQVHSYFYDVAGRLVLESYVRSKAAGSSVTEGIGYRYDVLGRNLGQAYYLKSGSNWLFQSANDYSTLQYNAHGEVTRIAVNGVYRQQNKYDAAGRIWATNSGDGIWKYFGYDKNGNQTLTIASAGYDLIGLSSISNAYSLASRNDVNATITKYDGRNQAISVVEEGRELGGSTVQLTTSRNYNAFGEVTSETDADGATITYTYNTMGRLITARSPQISITTEAGTNQNVRPTENFYYDTSGRLTGQRDANGNLTKYTLLAGSGYGGSQALVTRETHADGGTVTTIYNAHGDATRVTDEVGLVTNMSYDNLGRLTQVNNPGGLVDHYAYDVLGQRIWHYNSLLGSGNKETTDYDIQGRIISQRAFGGDTTSTTYVRSSTIATPGMGTFGGWTETTTYANGKTLVEKKDLFGRTIQRTDLGGNVTNFTYDKAGRLVEAASGLASNAYTYFNTGETKSAATTTSYQYYIPIDPYYGGGYVYASTSTSTANYTYDKVGNRLTELGTTSTTVNGSTTTETWKNQTATYDALGRLKTWQEAGTGTSPAANITYYYDAAGNVRRSTATYRQLGADGTVSATTSTQDFWFRYDSMNRLVVDRGILSDGVITRDFEDTGSKEILYDKAGRRVAVLNYRHTPGIYIPEYNIVIPGSYQEARESYQYDNAGRLSQADLSSGTAVGESYDSATGAYSPVEPIPSAPASGTRRASFTYDAMGRLTLQREYEADGIVVAHDRSVSYNAKNQISSDITNTKRGSDLYKATSTYNYGSGASYALGSVVSVTTSNLKNGSYQAGTSTSYTYTWRDGAVQSQISFDGNTGSSSNPLYTTSLSYDAAGRLTSAYISDGKPRSVTYRIDENGQIIRRDESRPSNVPTGQTGSPHEVWYRFGGRELGYVGNNGTSDVSYPASIAERQTIHSANPGTFRNGSTYGASYADFAQSYDPINSYAQGAAGGSYTVQTGDTLQTIAQTIWGDSNLWYKLAEANGLSGNAGLIEGQVLMLPAGVVRTAHNAGTVKPYDPNAAIGDLSPTTPAPPKTKNKGCGGFGQILLAVVAVAVTAIVAPQLIGVAAKVTGATTATVVGGGLAGAAGSVASQAVGLATGIQDKFSFKGVALAAIGGGIGGAVSASGLFGGVKSGVVQAGLRGATSSLAGQGIAIATGLQSKFDFAGVAAAGVGSAVGMAGARRLGVRSFNAPGGLSAGNIAGHALAGTAGAIANAATRSAINGNSFGDNLMRAMPDVVGVTVGNALAEGIASRGSPKGDIVVNHDAIDRAMGNLPSSVPSIDLDTGFSPETRIALMVASGEISSVTASVLRARVTEIKTGLRDDYLMSADPRIQGTVTADGLIAQPTGGVDIAISMFELNNWRVGAHDVYQGGYIENGARKAYSESYYSELMKGYDDNETLIHQWDAVANSEINEVLRTGLAPVDIGMGGYNITTGNGGLRDYLAVGGMVPAGKMLGMAGAAIGVKSFSSFSALKRYLGSPGAGNQWHHIVEQTPGNLRAFGAEVIHSIDNVVAIPTSTHIGKGSISAYYSSKDFFTNGQTVRQWLSTQSFQVQRQFGLDTLKRFGK